MSWSASMAVAPTPCSPYNSGGSTAARLLLDEESIRVGVAEGVEGPGEILAFSSISSTAELLFALTIELSRAIQAMQSSFFVYLIKCCLMPGLRCLARMKLEEAGDGCVSRIRCICKMSLALTIVILLTALWLALLLLVLVILLVPALVVAASHLLPVVLGCLMIGSLKLAAPIILLR